MVVRFAIEPDALLENSVNDPRALKAQHKRLIELWERYGILVDPGEGIHSITDKFSHERLQAVRDVWLTAWRASHVCRRMKPVNIPPTNWANINSPSELAALSESIELALVETTRGIAYLGIADDDDQFSVDCGTVEACLFQYPEQSRSFNEMIDLSNRTVFQSGQASETVWDNNFKLLVSRSRTVTILDRYAFTDRNLIGMCNVLKLLCSDMSDGIVNIFASRPEDLGSVTIEDQVIVSEIKEAIDGPECGVESVNLFLIADRTMSRERYVRFDQSACSLGHGISELFNRDQLTADMPCSFDTTTTDMVDVIDRAVELHQKQGYRCVRFRAGSYEGTENVLPS